MSNCTYARSAQDVQGMYGTVGQMDNCEGVFAAWQTDMEAIQKALPAPLMAFMPVVEMYCVNVYDPNFSTPYLEAALIIPCLYEGQIGLYPVSFMLTGTDNAVFVGRDQLGMPKKHADSINLYRNGDHLHTDITRLGVKIFDLDMEIGSYNDDMVEQLFGDQSNPPTVVDGLDYFFKFDMDQDSDARIAVSNVRLLSYHGNMNYKAWEDASITTCEMQPSDSDPWAMFPVVQPLGGSWTTLDIGLLGTTKVDSVEADDELVGKLLSGKYDSPQFGLPTRMFLA
jgi:acetoacetate decarboxylase